MGKTAKAVSGFSIDPAFHPYYGREDATMKPMTQAVAIAAGMAAGAAVAYTVTHDQRKVSKTVHKMARSAEKALADIDRMVQHYAR